MTIILMPGIKIAPAVFRWRTSRASTAGTRVLQRIERDSYQAPLDAAALRRAAAPARRRCEATVTKLAVPPAFGDLLYDLRGHIDVVRESLVERRRPTEQLWALRHMPQ